MFSTNNKYLSLLVTIALFILMFGAGSVMYPGFFSFQNIFNILINNSYLIIIAIGMTLVIISGGIDLSVGSLLAFSTMLAASLLENYHMSPVVVIPLVLATGSIFGCFMGCLIQYFDLPPFIITLAGLYLARGMCYVVSIDTIPITNSFFTSVAQYEIHFSPDTFISINVVIALVMILIALYLAHYTKFGRTVYAIGGNEQSALLMGLPVAQTKVLVYTFSGFCSALAGIVFTFYMLSGYALHGTGLELDTIAAVVIGGTLLTGGVGYIAGTIFGVLVFGTIQVLVTNQSLNSWWTRIAVGILIFLFCLIQRLFESGKAAGGVKTPEVSDASVKKIE
ncbi:MAG: galactofuranose ABC transporter, permease protein YjfF [Brevinematales bacterium]